MESECVGEVWVSSGELGVEASDDPGRLCQEGLTGRRDLQPGRRTGVSGVVVDEAVLDESGYRGVRTLHGDP